MKKVSRILILLSVFSVFAIKQSKAQEIVVKERLSRPTELVVRKPERPSPNHVWVAEEWTQGVGTYVYHAGYWALPPHPHATWVSGHWAGRKGGYAWVPGHWR